jgi:hypothetical protein
VSCWRVLFLAVSLVERGDPIRHMRARWGFVLRFAVVTSRHDTQSRHSVNNPDVPDLRFATLSADT